MARTRYLSELTRILVVAVVDHKHGRYAVFVVDPNDTSAMVVHSRSDVQVDPGYIGSAVATPGSNQVLVVATVDQIDFTFV